ncbi:MAG: class I adenylate-forming enzyme family protein [Balneolaceae bacterium]
MNTLSIEPPHYPLPDGELQFLASEDELYDYRNLYAFASWLNEALESYEISDDRPVILFASSSNQQVFILAACWLLQYPFLPLSPEMTDSELETVLSVISPSVVITDNDPDNRLDPLPSLFVPSFKLELQGKTDLSLFSSYAPEKLMGYFLTSGSTGVPKIVPLKRRQILYASRASGTNFQPETNEYWLLCLPLNHIGGISIIIRCILYQAAIYRMDRFDHEQVITFLSENKLFQIASLVPTMLNRLLKFPAFRVHLDFQAILLGGGPITPTLIRQSIERGIPIVSSYGMTETCGQIAANPYLKPSGIYHPKKSVGRIFKPNSVQIRDDSGRTLSQNEAGMVWVRGPQVFDGYLDKRQNEGNFDRDGWFRTGDYGYLNRYDQLFIETRRTDLILTGGENVNPFEVESALEDLENIAEAAVVGVADAEWGQAVTAFVLPANGCEPEEESLKSSLRKTLSPYKIPKRIVILDEFPFTASGKIDRKRLREGFAH